MCMSYKIIAWNFTLRTPAHSLYSHVCYLSKFRSFNNTSFLNIALVTRRQILTGYEDIRCPSQPGANFFISLFARASSVPLKWTARTLWSLQVVLCVDSLRGSRGLCLLDLRSVTFLLSTCLLLCLIPSLILHRILH